MDLFGALPDQGLTQREARALQSWWQQVLLTHGLAMHRQCDAHMRKLRAAGDEQKQELLHLLNEVATREAFQESRLPDVAHLLHDPLLGEVCARLAQIAPLHYERRRRLPTADIEGRLSVRVKELKQVQKTIRGLKRGGVAGWEGLLAELQAKERKLEERIRELRAELRINEVLGL